MKTIKENAICFSLLLYLFLIARQHFFFLSLVFVCWLWYFRVKDHSWIFLLIICFSASIPFYNTSMPSFTEAKAIKVNGSYSILQKGNTKVIAYTDEPLRLDATYTFSDTFHEIESTKGFYRFDYGAWCNQQGIYYAIDSNSLTCIKNGHSFRAWIQKRIADIEDEEERKVLYRTVLNIKDAESEETDWIYQNGFSFAGILGILNGILKYFMDQRKRNIVMCILTIVFALIYRFPLLIVESLLFRFFSFTKLSYKQRTGAVMSIVMILYPSSLTSASFLIPAIYRYAFLFEERAEKSAFYLVLLLQNLLFQCINPLKNIAYRFLQKMYGLIWLFSLIRLFFPVFKISVFTHIMNLNNAFLAHFDMKGSMLGLGCIFYVLFCINRIKKKSFLNEAIILLLVFQILGLFHPFAEISVINVGQGDSILLRGPFNSTNILIDTGKPGAWNALQTFLDAKGITHLDGLIITHEDDDHSGNRENVIDQYDPEIVIEEHIDSYKIGIYQLFDINTIDNEDENQSAIVNVLEMNQMQVCLMADADETSEEKIIEKYSQLHCDVLKAGHHGSKTSSSDDFLDVVRPKLALISSGAYSIYHHPSPSTIQKLLKRHIPYFDTKTSGDISIICLPFMNVFITSAFEIGFI